MKSDKIKCLVLGANGFIGSSLVEELLRQGHYVRAFDRYSADQVIYDQSINENLDIVKGDFLNQGDVNSALQDIDYVYHFIWLSNPSTSAKSAYSEIDLNVKYSLTLLDSCVSHKIQKVVFASSGGTVYGDSPTRRRSKESDPTYPISPYGIAKLTIENFLRYYQLSFGLDYTTFRISNPYGQRQQTNKKQGIFAIFKDLIAQNKTINIYGDGSNVRDYIDVDLAVRIMVELSMKEGISEKLFNIGSGQGKSVIEVVHQIEKLLDKKANIIYQDSRSFDVNYNVLCTDLIKLRSDIII